MDMNKNHEDVLEKLENEIITRSKSYSYHKEYARAMAKKDIEIERMKEYVSDARKEKIQNRKLKEELRIYKMTADEFADVFVKVGELVENTNLPRIGEQLVIEFRKIKEENEYLNNRYKNAIKIIDATEAYDIDLDCDNEVDDYLEGLL